jgi:hypothetical protein
LSLQPLEEFLASNPQTTTLAPHDLMKARLLQEYTQRKALVKLLQVIL